MSISFGTDGWRARIAEEFTFENLMWVVWAIGRHLQGEVKESPIKVIIGYDQRFLSPEFASRSAQVLMGMGFSVHLLPDPTPTPATAFAIKTFQAHGGLMITASHNPPQYNGIKFIPQYAGPALPAVTASIEGYLKEEPGSLPLPSLAQGRKRGLLTQEPVKHLYLQHLLSLIQGEAIAEQGLEVAIDPMHGAGATYLETVMEELGIPYQVLHGERDPLFGGGLPDPTAERLTELAERVQKGCHLGIGLDGDGDRFGIISDGGQYFSPNQVLFMLYHYLLAVRGMEGGVVRSVATTHMLDRVAQRFNYPVYETPVGFKYVGERLHQGGVILGGEESGGFSISGHIPEKDGILASLLVLEMMAVMKKGVGEILAELQERYGHFVTHRLDLQYPQEKTQEIRDRIAALSPSQIAGIPVEEINPVDGRKFLLQDGAWALIRPSGTEPVVRIYVEAQDMEVVSAIQRDLSNQAGLCEGWA